MKDYSPAQARLILREMTDDLCVRLRKSGSKTALVHCYCGYSDNAISKGFARQARLDIATDDNDILYHAILRIFDHFVVECPIRTLGIGFGKLSPALHQQYSLLESTEAQRKNKKLWQKIDILNEMYGRNAVLRASSLLSYSTIKERHGYIGGHKA